MYIKKAHELIEQVAFRNGVTQSDVIREIEAAISVSWANPDPSIQAFWRKVPRTGEVPTASELIDYLVKEASQQLRHTPPPAEEFLFS